ncbi:bifunctional 3'-5' exonuclease/DNA polymerase [Actinorugispora endophytica]|uniref:DNA-directed DNA polymerase n=1 Tax=Actinorugispora endophytica TaxID=1605990 RepID=A0A4R6UQP9_9ACTN|nr:bifunctional 3'-5' exonuclease/DNA polymerase [Actinorugispora endophytica]TDQ49282.1 DNA polymerase-1 [Actinorugispora endophytica]
MRIAVVTDFEGGARLRELAADGTPTGPVRTVSDLAGVVADYRRHATGQPRWVWASTGEVYPPLVERSLRLGRCHDVGLVEALLLGYHGRLGEAHSLGAAWARLHGRPVPDDLRAPPGAGAEPPPALFEPDLSTLPPGVDRLDALVEVHADQQRRIAGLPEPGRFALLAAVESAGALAAVEMAHDGVPWRADVHDAILAEQLGPRPSNGARPPVLAELAARISAEFGREVNPDSPAQLLRAFAAIGHPVGSTRSWELRQVEHPVVPFVLRYKELSRLHSACGWAWLDTWVRHGRFRPDYVVGGVVSGRWATRGGGALQIPKTVRRAVRADPGWTLVSADAGQLEPRVLAAVSGDRALAAAAGSDDLYARLGTVFGGGGVSEEEARQRAKIGVLSAMYGQTSGDAAALLSTMRRAFPRAMEYVDTAARAGEEGRLVRSWLGRTCPPPSSRWRRLVSGGPGGEPDGDGGRAARERGRFTRNFVVQATAAEWALVFLAGVRRRLVARDTGRESARLVFFQHDELVLHVPEPLADDCVALLREAEEETRLLLFGDTEVRFPLDIAVVDCYADA